MAEKLEMRDPRDVILAFLRDLPVTIKPGFLHSVLIYGAGVMCPVDKRDSLETIVKEFIDVEGFPQTMSHVLCSISAIDFAFYNRGAAPETLDKIAAIVPEMLPAALAAPLIARHRDSSEQIWTDLRDPETGPLGYKTLAAFERTLAMV